MGVENFTNMVETVNMPKVDVIAEINNGGSGTKVTGEDKLVSEYEDLATNDPSELERIKNVEPSRFEKMFNAWNK